MKMIQIQDLFEVYNSQNLALNACTVNEQSSYVLINRSEKNNGIAAKINAPTGKQPFPCYGGCHIPLPGNAAAGG